MQHIFFFYYLKVYKDFFLKKKFYKELLRVLTEKSFQS